MTTQYPLKIKYQVFLFAALLIVIVAFNLVAANLIDSFQAKLEQDHQGGLMAEHPSAAPELISIKRYILYGSILMFLLASLVMYRIINGLTRPVKKIQKGLDTISRGDLSFRLTINSKDEFSQLADHFNQMADQLESMMTELETAQKDLSNQVKARTTDLDDTNKRLAKAMQELQATQKRIIQAETQKSLTAIVSGFAHEINNPLTGILGIIDLMEIKNEIPQPIANRFSVVKREALRIKSVIDELNQLNPEIDQTKFYINLANLLEKMIKICQKKSEFAGINLELLLPNNPIVIRGNHTALWQVLEGALMNSAEAIRDREIPDGRISASLAEPDVENETRAKISISDNGGGFQNLEKAFDPFYTTKDRTRKKGIGLSIAYNLVREHGGNIIISNKNDGAILDIYLPFNEKINDTYHKPKTMTGGQ